MPHEERQKEKRKKKKKNEDIIPGVSSADRVYFIEA
jgi:hypothetical protein